MNPSVNRFSESPQPSGSPSPESSDLSSKSPITDNSETIGQSTPAEASKPPSSNTTRKHPIPPPSEPMQYRAIGLIRGQYQPSPEQLTQGNLLVSDSTTVIDAVLLGRVLGLVKKHLDLEQSHLWVVYPRTRQEDENLHVQIVGVWEPESLSQSEPPDPESSSAPTPSSEVEDRYFSLRGEVIYHSRDEEKVVVKIIQSPRRESESAKYFKLNLKGTLPDRAVNHFWDLQVQLDDNTLVIQQATDMGLLPSKKRKPQKRGQKSPTKRPSGQKSAANSRPTVKDNRTSTNKPSRREPLPKPTKRKD